MELSVAIDKLNSMTKEEIIEEAFSLNCHHEKQHASNCLIANLLHHWGVTRARVLPLTGIFIFKDDKMLGGEPEEHYSTPTHVKEIIEAFDDGRPL